MKKHFYLIAILLTLVSTVCFSQKKAPVIEWEKKLDLMFFERSYASTLSNDGYLLFIGYSYDRNKYLFSKVNSNGEIVSEKDVEAFDYQLIENTEDNGYLITGSKFNAISKLNSNMEVEWAKSYGGSEIDNPSKILETSDGGYIIAGMTASNDGDVSINHGERDGWIIKLNKSGELEWEKSYGDISWDRINEIIKTKDGNYIFIGNIGVIHKDSSKSDDDAWIVKINPLGEILWEKKYGGTAGDVAYSITELSNGGYIVASMTGSSDLDVSENNGSSDIWLIKIDDNGELEWEKTYGGSNYERPQSIVQTEDNGLLCLGYTTSSDGDVTEFFGWQDIWLFKTDSIGKLEWEKTFGTSWIEDPMSIVSTSDSYIISGFYFDTSLKSTDWGNVWLAKVSNVTDVPESLKNFLTLSISQNPANNSIDFTITSEPGEALKVELYDLSGNIIYRNSLASAGINKINVNSTGLSSGVYQLVVRSQKGVVTEKVVVAR